MYVDKSSFLFYGRNRRMLAGISIVITAVLFLFLTLFICRWLTSLSSEGLQEYIQSFGVMSWLVFLALQFVQVFIALIPGELLETAAGFCFGPFWGTVLCYVGMTGASMLIFSLTRRFGIRLVEIFISRETVNELRFINTARKRNNLIFLLFFIPGTPKDLFTYFAGLTDIRLIEFLAISLSARIPSVVSSTYGGHLLGEGKYIGAFMLYTVVGILSLTGLHIYNSHILHKNRPDI